MTLRDFVKYGGDRDKRYRSYPDVPAVSFSRFWIYEFMAMVVESIEELDNGNVAVDPFAFTATSMDHVCQLSGLLKWIWLWAQILIDLNMAYLFLGIESRQYPFVVFDWSSGFEYEVDIQFKLISMR